VSYSLRFFARMVADRVRTKAYTEALRRTVRPGCVVLDLGTGFGIHALLACQLGAGRVYAVDPSNAVQVGRELARANGFGDRIEFIQDLSTRVELPTRADVIVSDLRGALPLYQGHIPSLADARARHLAPNGVLIPKQDDLYMAVLEAEETYRQYRQPWGEHSHGFDFGPLQQRFLNAWDSFDGDRGALLTAPARWASVEYTTVTDANLRGSARWSVERGGIGHGLRVWFDATLLDGVTFSTGPTQEARTVYGASFFPWQDPVPLLPGDEVVAEIRADLVGEEYIWTWSTRVTEGGSAGRVKAHFRQSTFTGQLLSLKLLERLPPGHVPGLGSEGRLVRFVLEQMDTGHSVEAIARALLEKYPSAFSDERAALGRVRAISAQYGA
jgi:protein arginine N-methyltransferase 1